MAFSTVAQRLSRKDYESRLPKLRERLVQLQVKLKEAPFKVILIVAGVKGSGRGDLINTLSGWLDPRGVETFAFHEPTDEERERPLMWRYWRALPATGRIGIFAGSWYTETLRREVVSKRLFPELQHELGRIRHFEKLLSDNGTLILKVWLHMSKPAQRRRFKLFESDEHTTWRVTEDDWHHHRLYDRLARLSGNILRATHRPGARWAVIDAEHERSRNLEVVELLLGEFEAHYRKRMRLAGKVTLPPRHATPLRPLGLKRLRALPLDQDLSAVEYEAKREKWLGKLNQIIRGAAAVKRSIVFVFEGWDAAGKGGAIRRLTNAIDARDFRVIPISKPSDEEKAHHYLWRFWRHIPRAGLVTIFDRSWYGRVLVERLEGFARNDEWRRAYQEINDFEQQLSEDGTIVIKFWLHISKDEQLRRFRERENLAYKQHKINEEDWRNRRKWQNYEVAVGDMLMLTNHLVAPWHLIPANNKRYARLQILRSACKQIEEALA